MLQIFDSERFAVQWIRLTAGFALESNGSED